MSLKQPNTSSGLIMSRNIIVESEAQEQERKRRKIEAADKAIATRNKKALLHANNVKIIEEIREAYSKGEDWKKKRILHQLTGAYRALGQKGTPKLGEMIRRLTTLLAANTAVVDNIELDKDAEDESKISECGDEDIQ